MSFGNLMLAEAGRLRHRSRFGLALLAAVLLGLVGPPLWMRTVVPLTADDYAAAAAQYEVAKENCTDCSVDTFLRTVWGFHETVYIGIAPWLLLLTVFVLLVVLVYTSADFASGAITTQLTFTPNRLKLLCARVLTCGLLGAVLMGLSAVALSGLSVVWYVAVRGFDSLPSDSGLLGAILGGIFLGFVAGMLGALLVFILHGGAYPGALVVAILLGCLLVEAIAYDVNLPHFMFYLMPTRHAESLVVGLANPTYEQAPLNGTELLTRPDSVAYFVGLLVVAGVLAVISFQRRDIKN
ncbi:MAG: hypothetical protein Q4G35_01895 [Propionibacteriaceae bacterium]|nr:hypothetical protein [Propionibacteriaceae bacterium]